MTGAIVDPPVAAAGAARWRRPVVVNAALVMLSLLMLIAMEPVTGVIDVRGGRGWDGGSYAAMLEEGWDKGSANTALRPLIVMLNTPAFLMTGNAIAAFRAMNYAYVALLALGICLLFDRYSADAAAKTLLLVNVLLSIATLKYLTYYPVLIDAGAYAVITLALYAIVAGRRTLAALLCLAAVLSREFGIAVLVFGVVREIRMRVPVWKVALTYGPATVLFFGWRAVVAGQWAEAGRGGDILTLQRLVAHLQQWQEPMFSALFVYFLLTVFGGVSLFVAAKAGIVLRHLRREPEWVLFGGAILAASATGSNDMWRYLAYLVPAFVVLFAVAAREIGLPRRRIALAAIMCAATVLTQRPLQAMTVEGYFRDWFPYYVHVGNVPEEAGMPELWPLWAWRFMMTVGLLWLLAAFPAHHQAADADRA